MSKEKKIHFNFIDILIILFFVVLIGGFGFYATGNWQTNTGSSKSMDNHIVRYTITAENLRPEVAGAIKTGDVVKDSAKETVKGTIAEIKSISPFEAEIFNANEGFFVKSTHPENLSVVMTVESSYVLNGNTIMIDDMEIKVGKSIHFKTPGYAFSGYITDFEIIEK